MGLQRLYHRLIVLKRNLNLVMHKILRKTLKYLLWLSVNVSVIVSVILFIAVVNYVNKLPPRNSRIAANASNIERIRDFFL